MRHWSYAPLRMPLSTFNVVRPLWALTENSVVYHKQPLFNYEKD
jgi:hypothetical protein